MGYIGQIHIKFKCTPEFLVSSPDTKIRSNPLCIVEFKFENILMDATEFNSCIPCTKKKGTNTKIGWRK
jgi:hypothetical protein